QDGAELYDFDQQGRHIRTLDTLTKAVKYVFGYSPEGFINTITNTDGLITTIARDGTGKPTAIIAPNGQQTTLAIGSDGYLARITNPGGDFVSFTYGASGLMATQTDLRGGTHIFMYDDDGKLTNDQDPAGGFSHLVGTSSSDSTVVAVSSAEGVQEI